MDQRTTELFLAFLRRDMSVLEQVQGYQGQVYIEQEALVFSLAGLHALLCLLIEREGAEDSMDYRAFRRLLYQGNLNERLKAEGARIVIHAGTGKVESNLYRLERYMPADSDL